MSSPAKSLSNDGGYNTYFDSFHLRNNSRQKFCEMISGIAFSSPSERASLDLGAAKSCLAVGANDGRNEMYFIKHLMPNLQTFTAVEPDAASAAELRLNLQRHLSSVDGVVVEKSVQEFLLDEEDGDNNSANKKVVGRKYDVVLLFHVLYYINDKDRRSLFSALFERLVRPGGLVVIDYDGSRNCDTFSLMDAINPDHRVPSCDDLVDEFRKAGFLLERQYEYFYSLDFSEPDEELLVFWCDIAKKKVSMEEFRAAVRSVWPEGKTDSAVSPLSVFKKPLSG